MASLYAKFSVHGPKLNESKNAVVSIIVILGGKKNLAGIAQTLPFQEMPFNPKI